MQHFLNKKFNHYLLNLKQNYKKLHSLTNQMTKLKLQNLS